MLNIQQQFFGNFCVEDTNSSLVVTVLTQHPYDLLVFVSIHTICILIVFFIVLHRCGAGRKVSGHGLVSSWQFSLGNTDLLGRFGFGRQTQSMFTSYNNIDYSYYDQTKKPLFKTSNRTIIFYNCLRSQTYNTIIVG